ncbi:hypothetical protein, partial [Microbacterium sp.]|uniref:hypothetical protein n=1 Tax=Microbacterium sp. TaxID=51671 RepID=UPI0028A75CF4
RCDHPLEDLMSDEHAHDASEPAEGEYTDADHGDGTTAGDHAAHAVEAEGEYTDGVYSADGREQHLPHHGEGAYTDADHAHADADPSGARGLEAEGEYTDGRYPDDGDAGRADRRHS